MVATRPNSNSTVPTVLILSEKKQVSELITLVPEKSIRNPFSQE
jgi:hypothetical protein